jgi:hypothetical protein
MEKTISSDLITNDIRCQGKIRETGYHGLIFVVGIRGPHRTLPWEASAPFRGFCRLLKFPLMEADLAQRYHHQDEPTVLAPALRKLGVPEAVKVTKDRRIK